jgi:polysaccharide biosynthesis protein PslG
MRHTQRFVVALLLLILTFGAAGAVYGQEATEEATVEPSPETTEAPEVTEEPEVTETPAEEVTEEAEEATEEPEPTETETPASGQTYVVQPGDNLYRIAIQFGTTISELAAANGITNPRLIFTGQTLIIPDGGGSGGLVTPEPTEPPTSGETYTIAPGDNLYRIAIRFGTTVSELVALNDISNPNIIYSGRVLRIPDGSTDESATSEETTEEEVSATEEPADEATDDDQSADLPAAGVDFAPGIEVFFDASGEVPALVSQVQELGVEWVRIRVDWRMMEPTEGQVDYTTLDSAIDALEDIDVSILLTPTNAPAWARTSADENGPPDDLANYTNFVSGLAERYAERVDAYEIWDEPNLRRNWNCDRRMCDTDYIEMLNQAAEAIEESDSSAAVISAGLAPTRFNDRINAIDDRAFLEAIVRNASDAVDGYGVHPAGFANPPDAECCEQPPGVESHYEDEVFYFLENLRSAREIAVEAGDPDTPLWVTEFGWGSSEDTEDPGSINVYVSYTSLAQQAVYAARAFELGEEVGYVGPMILSNLNGCVSDFPRSEVCYTSLLAEDGSQRTIFGAVEAAIQGEEVEVEATAEPES